MAPLSTFTCPLRFGARSLQQSFLNRHDYARMHSFDFHMYPVSRAQALDGTWYRFEALKQARTGACAVRRIWRVANAVAHQWQRLCSEGFR